MFVSKALLVNFKLASGTQPQSHTQHHSPTSAHDCRHTADNAHEVTKGLLQPRILVCLLFCLRESRLQLLDSHGQRTILGLPTRCAIV